MVAVNSLDIGERAVITGSVASSEHVGFNPETLVRNWHLRQAIKFLSHSNIVWDDVISQAVKLEEIPETVGYFMSGGFGDKIYARYLRIAVSITSN